MQGLVAALLRQRLRVFLLVVSLNVIDHLVKTEVVLLHSIHVKVSRVQDKLLGLLMELPTQVMPNADGRNAFDDGETLRSLDLELLEDLHTVLVEL